MLPAGDDDQLSGKAGRADRHLLVTGFVLAYLATE
jgi:hypothetical protein